MKFKSTEFTVLHQILKYAPTWLASHTTACNRWSLVSSTSRSMSGSWGGRKPFRFALL